MICNILIDRVLERGAPKKAEALVGAQLALQRSDRRIIHEKNIEKYLALRANSGINPEFSSIGVWAKRNRCIVHMEKLCRSAVGALGGAALRKSSRSAPGPNFW